MLIADLMTSAPVVAPASLPLGQAAGLLRQHEIRHLPVVDDDGILVGLLLDSEVFRRGELLDGEGAWRAFEPAWDGLTVIEVASEVDVAISNHATAEQALRKLADTKQDALVVVDAFRRPLGIFTEHDALAVARERIPFTRVVVAPPTPTVHALDGDEAATEALRQMSEQRIRHLVVRGAGLHVVSVRDLVMQDVSRRPELPLSACVTGPAKVGHLGDRLCDLATVMHENHIGCLPIVDSRGELATIVTRHDLMEAVLGG